MESVKEAAANGRGEQRLDLRHPVNISIAGEIADRAWSFKGTLLDLSTGGFLMESSAELSAGVMMNLDLVRSGRVRARLVWANSPLFGCEFDKPIARAVVDRVRSLSRPDRQPTEDELSIGKHIRHLRRHKGWTRAELAECAGVSRPSVWGWETERTVPRLDALRRLSAAFGCTVSELRSPLLFSHLDNTPVEGEDDKTSPPGVDAVLSETRLELAQRLDIAPSRIRLFFEVLDAA